MRRFFPVLAILAGLGILISCKHSEVKAAQSAQVSSKRISAPVRTGRASKKQDPYDRYLDDQKRNVTEPALARFAGECGVDLTLRKSKRAFNAGDKWFPTDDLSKPSDEDGTDFFSTFQVWSDGKRVLVESWDINGSEGEEMRALFCYVEGAPRVVESVAWDIPVVEGNGANAWGYSQRWKQDSTGKLLRSDAHFVNLFEVVIKRQELGTEAEESLNWTPNLGPLSELKLPASMLR